MNFLNKLKTLITIHPIAAGFLIGSTVLNWRTYRGIWEFVGVLIGFVLVLYLWHIISTRKLSIETAE